MEQSGKNIYFYMEVVLRRRWAILIPFVIATCIAALIAIKLPPSYLSTTLLQVEQQQVPDVYVTPADRTPFVQRLFTIRQQIMSRANMEKIINDFKLYKDDKGDVVDILYRILNKIGFKVNTSPGKEEMLERMQRDIEINMIGDKKAENAFTISYTGRDPYITMQVTNTLASLFIEESLKVREQFAEGTSAFLENELENAKKELEVQERAVRNFREKNMGGLPQQLEANLRTLDRLQMELQTLTIEIKSAEERKASLEDQLGQTVDAASGAQGSSLAAELEKLQNQLAMLLSVYKETYPDVIIAKKRINDIRELMAKSNEGSDDKKSDELAGLKPEVRNPLVYRNLVEIKSRILILKQSEADVRKQIKEFEKRVEGTPANEQKFIDLQRDYGIKLKNYQTLLEKKLNARLSENLEKRQKGERFRVINPANLPERPYKMNKYKVTFMGMAAGAGIGLALAFLIEFMNPAFRKPEEFAGVLPHPVLAAIPAFSSKSSNKREKKFKLVKGSKIRGRL